MTTENLQYVPLSFGECHWQAHNEGEIAIWQSNWQSECGSNQRTSSNRRISIDQMRPDQTDAKMSTSGFTYCINWSHLNFFDKCYIWPFTHSLDFVHTDASSTNDVVHSTRLLACGLNQLSAQTFQHLLPERQTLLFSTTTRADKVYEARWRPKISNMYLCPLMCATGERIMRAKITIWQSKWQF